MPEERLQNIIASIPAGVIGVYFFLDANDRILYIGKSIDIRKRLQQHFNNTSRKSLRMRNQVVRVIYENMGSELLALLRESEQIKTIKPLFNRALRRSVFLYGLYHELNKQGYIRLFIDKIDSDSREIMAFTSRAEAKAYLFRITEKHQLCQKINGLYPSRAACFHYSIKLCMGACIGKEATEEYNSRALAYIDSIILPNEDQLILLPGREKGERAAVLIEKGIYRGYGFFKGRKPSPSKLAAIIIHKSNNRDSQRFIKTFLRKQDITV